MNFDVQNQLAATQTFSSVDVGAYSFDKLTAKADPSIGRRMCVAFYPSTNTATTSVTVSAVQAAAATLATPDLLATVVVLTANVKVGKPIVVDFPQGSMTKRYLGIQVTADGGGSVIGDAFYMPADEVPVYRDFPRVVDASV